MCRAGGEDNSGGGVGWDLASRGVLWSPSLEQVVIRKWPSVRVAPVGWWVWASFILGPPSTHLEQRPLPPFPRGPSHHPGVGPPLRVASWLPPRPGRGSLLVAQLLRGPGRRGGFSGLVSRGENSFEGAERGKGAGTLTPPSPLLACSFCFRSPPFFPFPPSSSSLPCVHSQPSLSSDFFFPSRRQLSSNQTSTMAENNEGEKSTRTWRGMEEETRGVNSRSARPPRRTVLPPPQDSSGAGR